VQGSKERTKLAHGYQLRSLYSQAHKHPRAIHPPCTYTDSFTTLLNIEGNLKISYNGISTVYTL